MLEDVLRKGRLLDIYGPLLTERQERCMDMYFNQDLSLAEIGVNLEISRQGVHDLLHRASQSLEHYEAKLHLLERAQVLQREVEMAARLLEGGSTAEIEEAKRILHRIEL
ncbi:YlxM family DNA-binding protein [Megasphaera vaginalis (ex Srinivasan et al. 2021)]|uniref:UPF0122 protein HMPREF1250_2155 n=1 Tax=Megasphaera vaginalis (ex Srinivasan et al. 2021) TaxID=1111454 RepID=U7US30_9FIRM|nr:sigma factor-like helix-turn-helix DNA-binding protein [Megasphaera vaginalis (ex Srinivasan et al. 2021)]ERT61689.1 transcriptional regulator, YlxM/p13 family [Megasphaera vaginalis (ex Srinivasan et al. 2021)]